MEKHEHKLTEENEEMEAQTFHQCYLRKKRIVIEIRIFVDVRQNRATIPLFYHSNAST